MTLVDTLTSALASTFALYFKTHCYHWNITGPTFPHLHRLFEDQYTDMWEAVDTLAEHIRQQDEFAPTSLSKMVSLSQISEDEECPNARQMVLNLIAEHEAVIMVLNAVLAAAREMEDEAVATFIGDRLAAHSKMRWMLKATAS